AHSSINTIARSFASNTIKWDDIDIYNIKNLYDINNKLVAYSIDIKNNKNGLLGYEILSAISEDDPVLEFSKTKCSPYNKVENGYKCIYEGALNYYYQNKTTIYNIQNKTTLNEKEIILLRKADKNKEYKSDKTNKVLKSNNLVSSFRNKSQDTTNGKVQKILENVPDELWYRGCTPTAVAMVLEYDFYNDTPEFQPLTDDLANAFGTNSDGFTTIDDHICDSIKSVMKKYGVNNIWCQLDGQGKDNSTYEEYVNEINNNHPVVVNLYGSKETSYGYPDGFKDHSCAGIGYEYTDNEKFIVIHDDALDDSVYCDFNSSDLGINQWLYIH
ncbi:C39 family peptidase, partial [Clostridium acetobutylicum]